MNFKYIKTILSFGFAVMNGVLAMENSSNDTQSLSHPSPQLTFDSVQADYEQFLGTQDPALKIKIISDLNVLLRQGKIDANNKPDALEIAQSLKAGNLENSINFYQNIKFIKKTRNFRLFEVILQKLFGLPKEFSPLAEVFSPFENLPQELLVGIITHLVQGPIGLKEAMNLLRVNKSFYRTVTSSPVDIYLFNCIDFKCIDLASFLTPCDSNKAALDHMIFKIVQLFPNVRFMNLFGCSQITDQGFFYLTGLKNLTSLNLFQTDITDQGLSYLASLTQLTSLNLTGCNKIANKGLSNLAQFFPQLTSLFLESNRITDQTLSSFSGLKNLTSLNVRPIDITDQGLSNLASLTQLTSLRLSSVIQTSKPVLPYLVALKNLTFLDLYGMQIGYTDFVQLFEQMPNLKKIVIGKDVIKPVLIDQLRELFPHVTIIIHWS